MVKTCASRVLLPGFAEVRAAFVVSLAALLGSSCGGSTKSTNIETRGFYVRYTIATSAGAPPTATAEVSVGDASGVHLELVGGDSVACDGTPLTEQMPAGQAFPSYGATLAAPKPTYSFVLSRPAESDDAQTVKAPSPFSVTSSALDVTYDAQLTLTWTRVATAAKITIKTTSVDAGCPAKTIAENVSDSGSFAFDGSSFLPDDKSKPACTYEIALARDESSAPVGGRFAGGELISRALATVEVSVHP